MACSSLRQLAPTNPSTHADALLPLLYRTNTILLRQYATNTREAETGSYPKGRRTRITKPDFRMRTTSIPDEHSFTRQEGAGLKPRQTPQSATRPEGAGTINNAESTPRHGTPMEARAARRADHVPFIGLQDGEREMHARSAADDNDADASSTMTPAERKTFAKLFAMPPAPTPPPENPPPSPRNPSPKPSRTAQPYTLDSILDPIAQSLAPAFPPPLRTMAQHAQARQQREQYKERARARTVEVQGLREAHSLALSNKRFKKVDRAMRNAATDVELWGVVDRLLLRRLRELDLDGRGDASAQKGEEEDDDDDDDDDGGGVRAELLDTEGGAVATLAHAATPKPPPKPYPVPPLTLLARHLPRHLTTYLSLLATHFPTSSLPLALLPALHRLGPSAFALGTSTPLYNAVLSFLHTRYADLDGMHALLSEMDANVIGFDAETESVLAEVLRGRGRVDRGVFGEGARVLADMRGRAKGCGRIFWWARVVRERGREEALMRAREAEREEEVAD